MLRFQTSEVLVKVYHYQRNEKRENSGFSLIVRCAEFKN